MTTVDVHTHFLPLAITGELERRGIRFERDTVVTPTGMRVPIGYNDLLRPHDKLAAMDDRGIAAAIVTLTPHLFLYGSVDHAKFARLANDALAEFVEHSPRLAALGTLPIGSPTQAAIELERCVAQLGMRGAQIGTSLPDGTQLDEAGLDALWEAAEGLGVPIALHPYYAGPFRREELFLHNSVGVPLDTCLAAARLMCSGLLDRWTGVSFVLPHGAGYLPFQLGRLDQSVDAKPHALRCTRRPSEYLDRFFADTVVHADPALRLLAEMFGPRRLLMGTDLPYLTGVNRPVEHVERAGLDPDELGANAVELFGLPV
jgi:aminocarboxymuconate-semialdehyde decarboxylase